MVVKEKTKKVPRLRFAADESDSFTEWISTDLNSVGEIITGSTPATDQRKYYDGTNLFVSPVDIEGQRYVVSTKTNLSDEGFAKGRIVKSYSSLFVCIGSTIGKVAQVVKDCVTNQQINAVVVNDKYDSNFIFSLLEFYSPRIKLIAGKQAVPIINKTEFSKTLICVPGESEQKKIGDFLSSVDKKLELLAKKKELLEKYKKGLMQKIFSQELRFKDEDGGNFQEWTNSPLGMITKIFDGTHQTPDYVEQGIPFYSVEHVTRNDFNNTKFISKEVYKKEIKRVKIERGDILLTRIGDIGSPKLVDWDVEASFYVSLALIKNSNDVTSEFLVQMIKSNYFQRELHKRTIHVAFPKKINLGEIGSCLIFIPSIEEQKKISSFLRSIDSKINALINSLDALRDFKKGLLQQMFV